jgi:hypothetical protein
MLGGIYRSISDHKLLLVAYLIHRQTILISYFCDEINISKNQYKNLEGLTKELSYSEISLINEIRTIL